MHGAQTRRPGWTAQQERRRTALTNLQDRIVARGPGGIVDNREQREVDTLTHRLTLTGGPR